MVVIDSSAIVAILFREPLAAALSARLAADRHRVVSVVNYVETGTVLAGRRHGDKSEAITHLNLFLDEAGIELSPVDAAQARLALEAGSAVAAAWVMVVCSISAMLLPMRSPNCARRRCSILAAISARPIITSALSARER